LIWFYLDHNGALFPSSVETEPTDMTLCEPKRHEI